MVTFWTGWNSKLCARETNYGTRIDYILVTRGILPWIKHGDIQPSVKGSDHCPVYIDLHDEITTHDGRKVFLHEVIPPPAKNKAALPRLAARRLDELSGKQTLLSAFFAKEEGITAWPSASDSQTLRSSCASPPQASVISPTEVADAVPPVHAEILDSSSQPCELSPSPRVSETSAKTELSAPSVSGSQHRQEPSTRSVAHPKRDLMVEAPQRARPIKRSKNVGSSGSGQHTLNAFFTQQPFQLQNIDDPPPSDAESFLASDYQLALCLSADVLSSPRPSQVTNSNASDNSSSNLNANDSHLLDPSSSKAAWSKLLAPVEPPKCAVHDEPAKLYTVSKSGPNKGKTFFLCSRYGPSLSHPV